MNTPQTTITYRFMLPDQKAVEFLITIDDKGLLQRQGTAGGAVPEWAYLENHQCPHCPLSKSEFQFCPPALNLVSLVEPFKKLYSYEEVNVEVITPNRTVSAVTSVQRAVSSLMGLIMATSDCPHLSFFRAMARFHLPFSTPEETIYRASSSWVLGQYLYSGSCEDGGLNKLSDFYAKVHEVNMAFAERVRGAAETDSAVNALVSLDALGSSVQMTIEDFREDLEKIYEPYFKVRDKEETTVS